MCVNADGSNLGNECIIIIMHPCGGASKHAINCWLSQNCINAETSTIFVGGGISWTHKELAINKPFLSFEKNYCNKCGIRKIFWRFFNHAYAMIGIHLL